MTSQNLKDTLEDLIDRNTAFEVIAALSEVCREKAEYVAEGGSHGDPSPSMAQQWQTIATRLDKASSSAAGL